MKRVNILSKDVALEYRYKNRWIYLIKRYFFGFVLAILILEISLFTCLHAVRALKLNKQKSSFLEIKEEISLLLVKLKNKEGEISRIKNQIKGVDKKIDDAEKRLNFLSRIRKEPKDFSDILTEVNTESPRKIWITHLSIKGNELKIIGGSHNTLLVTRFMSNLQQSPFFANADFVYTKKGEIEKVEVVEFEITCNVIRGKK